MSRIKNKIVTFGEVLLRICPSDPGVRLDVPSKYNLSPAGSEANVAVALANLNLPVEFITSLPDDALGQMIIKEIRKHGVNVNNVIFQPGRTGLFFQERGFGVRPSFVIYDRENSTFSKTQMGNFNWHSIWQGIGWFHVSGIVPAVSKQSCLCLKQIIQKMPKRNIFSVDLNYRQKLWGWIKGNKNKISRIMTEICKKADLICANETDLYEVFGYDKKMDFHATAKEIFSYFPRLKYLAISIRQSESATNNVWSGKLFIRDKSCFVSREYKLDSIVDRVGTGDAFTAGIIYGIINFSQNQQKIVDFAVALSALNHSTFGDFSSFTKQDVDNVLSSGGSGRIIR